MKNVKAENNKNGRILSFLQSQEFTETELKTIAGSGNTEHTPKPTYSNSGGADAMYDVTYTW